MDKAFVLRVIVSLIVVLNVFLALMGVSFIIPEDAAEPIAAVTLLIWGLWASMKNDFFKKKKK